MNISATIATQVTVAETLAYGEMSGVPTGGIGVSKTLTAGTGANAGDLSWGKKAVSLAASASVTYTLSALTDDLGRAVAFARFRDFCVDNSAATADGTNLLIASGATHGLTSLFGGSAGAAYAKAGGFFHAFAPLATGFVVASGSADQVTITNQGSVAAVFNIVIIGASV